MKITANKAVKASLFYLVGNLFDKAIAFITIPIFTRMLSTSEYGVLNTYTSWVSIFAIIVGLSLGQTLRSAYYEKQEELDAYLSSIYTLAIIDFVITVCLALIISLFFDFQITRFMLVLCVSQSFMQFVRDTYAMKLMMAMDYVKRTLVLAIPNILVALLSVFFIMLMDKEKYMGRIYAYVLVYAFIALTCLISQYYKGKVVANKDYWKYGLSLSLPLILHSISCVILSNSDRIMITKFSNASETGIYSLIYNMSMMTTVITSSFENVWIPWFSERMNQEDVKAINYAIFPYILGTSSLVAGVMFICPEVLMILAPKTYWGGKYMVPPLMCAVFITFLYTISVNLEYYEKSTKTIAKNTLIAAVTNMVLNWIFIPHYGAIAAAYTTLVSYFISFVLHYIDGKHLNKDLFPIKSYIFPLIMVSICVGIYYLCIDLSIIRWSVAIVYFAMVVIWLWKKNMLPKELINKFRLRRGK